MMETWSMELKFYLFVAIFILIMTIAIYLLFRMLRNRQIKRLYSLECNIYWKKGGKLTLNKDIRDNKFTLKSIASDGKDKMYFIVKEAIQDKIQKTLLGYKLIKYMDFEEGIAYPFIMSFKNGIFEKKFLGSERANQLYKEKIWDEVGGLGKSNIDPKLIYLAIGVILVAGVFYFTMMKK